jgi:hypothetical protein
MKVIREKVVMRVFCLFTGVIFMNMGFFLAEVCMMNFKDKQMIENVCNLVRTGGLEEERDGHSASGDAAGKVFPFLGGEFSLENSSRCLIVEKLHPSPDDLYLTSNHSLRFSPPPDHFISIS